ncbi:MAG: CBS domain-containing protein [Peptococcaceae bacterium]|nr:CBS domain-containing protein [Peptococcaceae bacterium]
MLAKDIMTKEVITVLEDATIQAVGKLFVEKNISGVPVVDEEGKLKGILSEGDLVYQQKPINPPLFINLFDSVIQLDRKEFWEDVNKIAARTAGELMTKTVITADENATVEELAKLMINKKVNRIPIVNAANQVIGLVSRHDVVKGMYGDD